LKKQQHASKTPRTSAPAKKKTTAPLKKKATAPAKKKATAPAKKKAVTPKKKALTPAEQIPASLALAQRAVKTLEEKNGLRPVIVDVGSRSGFTDYLVVVSGLSKPHLKAMLEAVQHDLKPDGILCHRRVGDVESGWLIMDYIDVVIHVLLEEKRAYYGIEDLWNAYPPQT
jgi:ribosome-associated protein